MKGHFVFKYLDGPNKDQTFKANIDEFEMRMQDGQMLVNTPEHIKNPPI
jgi:hypothetical protein